MQYLRTFILYLFFHLIIRNLDKYRLNNPFFENPFNFMHTMRLMYKQTAVVLSPILFQPPKLLKNHISKRLWMKRSVKTTMACARACYTLIRLFFLTSRSEFQTIKRGVNMPIITAGNKMESIEIRLGKRRNIGSAWIAGMLKVSEVKRFRNNRKHY